MRTRRQQRAHARRREPLLRAPSLFHTRSPDAFAQDTYSAMPPARSALRVGERSTGTKRVGSVDTGRLARTIVLPVVGEHEEEAHVARLRLRHHPVQRAEDALVEDAGARLQRARPRPVAERPRAHHVQPQRLRVVLCAATERRQSAFDWAQRRLRHGARRMQASEQASERTSKPVASAGCEPPKEVAVMRLYLRGGACVSAGRRARVHAAMRRSTLDARARARAHFSRAAAAAARPRAPQPGPSQRARKR
jgi:hypothetical protein